jgi:hypothetical protein
LQPRPPLDFGLSGSLAAASGPLRSAGSLTFGSNNVLFVGDITGAKIHAFTLRDKDLTSQTDVVSGNFHNFEGRDHVVGLDQKLAALFATTADNIVINDLAVHQPRQQIFFSVERGRGANPIPAAGMYRVQVGSGLEDVCGNNINGLFDRPLRKDSDPATASNGLSLTFQLR